MRIWTLLPVGRRSNWQPLGIETKDYVGPYTLGSGYSGFVINSPFRAQFVVEANTGAIVGNTLDEVRKDVSTCDAEYMRRQVNCAREKLTQLQLVEPDYFWSSLRMLGPRSWK